MNKEKCPFCNCPRKSFWWYDGQAFVVADDASKEDTLICFPHDHMDQDTFSSCCRSVAEAVLYSVGRAKWKRKVALQLDWENRTYDHAHVQLTKIEW
jgi:hypothetical protein